MTDWTNRRSRSMPKMEAIGRYWAIDTSVCYRCGIVARTERAHIIDRQYGGLDDVQNLLPLCIRCHREQPPFVNGEEWKAAIWFTSRSEAEYVCRVVRTMMSSSGFDLASDIDAFVASWWQPVTGSPVDGLLYMPEPRCSVGAKDVLR